MFESKDSELTELQQRVYYLEKEKEVANEDNERLSLRGKELSDRLGNSESLRASLERQLGD